MAERKNTALRWFSLPVFRFISTAFQIFRFIFLRQKIIRTFAFRTLFKIRFVILFFYDIPARTPNDIDISASYVLILLCPLPWDASRLIIFCDCQSLLERFFFISIKTVGLSPTVFAFNAPIKHCVFQKVFKFYANFRIIV